MVACREPAFGRRAGLLALAAAIPGPAWADGEAPVPRTLSPPAGMPLQAGGIDKTKAYYVFFNEAIDATSMRALRRQLTLLVEAGVTQVTLVVNSLGGAVGPMLVTYGFIRALPITVNTHVQSIAASAATMLFLAGQGRSADRNARFLFHPLSTTIAGSFDTAGMHDQMEQLAVSQDIVTNIYKDRTKLSDQELARFNHGQVTYSAEQARQSGVVQTVADLKVPGGQAARMLFLD